MKLSEILRDTDVKLSDSNDIEIMGIEYDSRKIKKGFLFFAVKGEKSDGNSFIDEALVKGAAAIISDSKVKVKEYLFLSSGNIRKTMAVASSNFYRKPSERIKLIGVTGTNGKTTITFLIKHILESSGFKTGLIGTIDYASGNEVVRSTLTTPECIDINRMLSDMIDSGMTHCAMEVSSIALVMHRTYGLKFEAAIFSNLTSEHLDFHKNMENYFEAKKMLFDTLNEEAFAISNSDDKYGSSIISNTKAKKILYSVNSPSEFKAENIISSLSGLKFNILNRSENDEIVSSLNGIFNVFNILAAFSAAKSLMIKTENIIQSIEEFEGVPGRFNKIDLPNSSIAIIDYSHTSDSLKNAVLSAREILISENNSGKLITIFGCGGNKDRSKRPVMGNIAVTNSDIAIITSDNPRFEDPFEIIDEILSGINDHKNYEIIENRESAIRRGLELSGKGDIVLICGKGHETYQEVKGIRTDFDDKKIVLKHKQRAEN
ncbi:UDP-N-acetylmuramoyl-L-alanyl-D-glutamate--2,6-diaminopimelate ligase [soil metagenome]